MEKIVEESYEDRLPGVLPRCYSRGQEGQEKLHQVLSHLWAAGLGEIKERNQGPEPEKWCQVRLSFEGLGHEAADEIRMEGTKGKGSKMMWFKAEIPNMLGHKEASPNQRPVL